VHPVQVGQWTKAITEPAGTLFETTRGRRSAEESRPRLCVSGGDHRLIFEACLGLADLEQARRGVLPDRLDEALRTPGRAEIFNTDQGAPFTGPAFTGLLKEAERGALNRSCAEERRAGSPLATFRWSRRPVTASGDPVADGRNPVSPTRSPITRFIYLKLISGEGPAGPALQGSRSGVRVPTPRDRGGCIS
jgi:hypothetical protein